VALHRPLLKARDLDAMQHLPRLDVADLEAEQIVDVDEAQRLLRVHREGADGIAERADAADHLVRARIGN
jgi:hypothetical protein